MTDNTTDSNQWQLVAQGDWLAGQRFDINDKAILGREADCDITIPGTHLSRKHAELIVTGNKLLVRDLGSSNGTYVNNERITEIELKAGDEIRFDVLSFRIEGPQEQDLNATMIRQVNTPSPRKKENPTPSASDKQWKTKPTAVGNRDKTIQITTTQKAVSGLWNLLAILIGIGTLIALGFLITQI